MLFCSRRHVKESLSWKKGLNLSPFWTYKQKEKKRRFRLGFRRETVEEPKGLIESDFEFVTDMDDCKIFRKQK